MQPDPSLDTRRADAGRPGCRTPRAPILRWATGPSTPGTRVSANERIIQYPKESAFWGQDLRRDVARAIRATAADPATAVPTAFLQIRPDRIAADASSVRLRRVEEAPAEITRQLAGSALKEPSRLSGLIRGLPQAEQEGERLLAYRSRDDAVRDLMAAGLGQIMAETAVTTVAARNGA